MRIFLVLIIIAALPFVACRKFVWENSSGSINPDKEPSSLKDGLVAYYPFNGNANDESGNGNNATISGPALSSDRFARYNSSFSFDGINDYIDLPKNATLNSSSGSLNVWVKTNGFLNTQRLIIGKPSGVPQLVITPDVQPSNYKVRIQWKSTVGTFPGVNSLADVSPNSWQMITAIYSPSFFSIYINGTLQNSFTTSLIQDNCLTSNIQIGGFNPSAGCGNTLGYTQMFFGNLDDIRIYNRALTQSEITYLATH